MKEIKNLNPFISAVDKLNSQSEDIFSQFTTTLQKLESIDSEISQEEAKREEEIKKLQMEQLRLASTKQKNTKLIDKINSFLND